MKKTLLIGAFVIILATASILIINCRPSIVGEWEAEIDINGLNNHYSSQINMFFYENGNGSETLNYTGTCKDFNYEIKDEKLRIDYINGSFKTFNCILKNETLTLINTRDDSEIVFTKK